MKQDSKKRKPFFGKADEMEMSINFKALRISWMLIGVYLIVWNFVEVIVNGELNLLPFGLIILQSSSVGWGKSIITKRMVKENKDEE